MGGGVPGGIMARLLRSHRHGLGLIPAQRTTTTTTTKNKKRVVTKKE